MGQPSGGNHTMAQPTVTVLPVRKSSGGSTLLFGAVALAVLVHRLGTWGAFDPTAYVRFVPQPLLVHLGLDRCGLLQDTSFILVSSRVAFANGFAPGAVLVERSRIRAVERLPADDGHPVADRARAAVGSQAQVLAFGTAVIAPGLIDVHVHMNEPGRVEWEGATTATRAAAAGGVTTLVDMPLNSVPTTTTAQLLLDKIAAVKGKAMVDVGFWGGMVPANSHNATELRAMLDAGALGFKSFFSPSGINDFPNADEGDVEAALPVLAAAGVPLLAHAELLEDVPPTQGDPRKYQTFLAMRPKRFEAAAIAMLIRRLHAAALADPDLRDRQGFGVHIAHLANAEALPAVAAAKAAGLPLTAEVNAHHLTWADADVPDGATLFKCMPPLRDRGNQEALWQGLQEGTIDMIASDHSPATPALKLLDEGDFLSAWGGIAGLQYSLPALVTGMLKRGVPLERTVAWWAERPAALANLHKRKGRLAPGFDADIVVVYSHDMFVTPPHEVNVLKRKGHLASGCDAAIVVFDPEAAANTTAAGLHHKHKSTPYLGMPLVGRVLATFVRGQQVFADGRSLPQRPCGALLLRKKR